jgi:hypothetical protein
MTGQVSPPDRFQVFEVLNSFSFCNRCCEAFCARSKCRGNAGADRRVPQTIVQNASSKSEFSSTTRRAPTLTSALFHYCVGTGARCTTFTGRNHSLCPNEVISTSKRCLPPIEYRKCCLANRSNHGWVSHYHLRLFPRLWFLIIAGRLQYPRAFSSRKDRNRLCRPCAE